MEKLYHNLVHIHSFEDWKCNDLINSINKWHVLQV